ncbi:MAG TPA: DUF86 domain-containing protein [Euryarchaeota archaeon]|nr:hypothetical protein BMS3Bbin15_00446 [archaeon BMS3Bbin15]HDL16163.1 DUF86 domain-containing protein [Euryarchaeota archaeon]
MVDERIADLLDELEEAVKDWERYSAFSLEELTLNRDKRNMALHAMLLSIQASIDISNYHIVKHDMKRPSTYRESFEILAEEGLIPRKLAEELEDLAGFRNVLVHIYWRLNLEEMYGVLKNDLKTIKEFIFVVKKILN